MSTPAMLRLRDARPRAHITLLTSAKLTDLWTTHPAVDEVIPFTKAEGVGNVSKRLRAGQFDLALIFPNSFRSAFESWMAGVPRRVGFAGSGRRMLLTHVVPRRPADIQMHKRSTQEVQRAVSETPEKSRDRYPSSGHHLHNYLHLVAAIGANPGLIPPRIVVSTEDIREFRRSLSIDDNALIVGLNPGAEYGPAKRWPAERFIEAALQIERVQHCTWIVTGGPGDAALGEQIAAGIRAHSAAQVHNLTGRTTLRELCVALAMCSLVLTNDTGPMHLAAAVGARVLVPFGSTSPELTGPGSPGDDRHRLIFGQAPCAPCFRRECPIDFRCMLSISPDRISQEAIALLNHPRSFAP